MEDNVIKFIILAIFSALIALLGSNRSIGYGWSFLLCLFLTPFIGLIIILCSKRNKKNIDFTDINNQN